MIYHRKNPFGLIIVLQPTGDAFGDLFYDDGESIDTVANKLYYYTRFKWSTSEKQLSITIEHNNYLAITDLYVDSLSIYGMSTLPKEFKADNRIFAPQFKSGTHIVEVTGLKLNMGRNWTIVWSEDIPSNITTISLPNLAPKYRVDCHPDNGNRNMNHFFANFYFKFPQYDVRTLCRYKHGPMYPTWMHLEQ